MSTSKLRNRKKTQNDDHVPALAQEEAKQEPPPPNDVSTADAVSQHENDNDLQVYINDNNQDDIVDFIVNKDNKEENINVNKDDDIVTNNNKEAFCSERKIYLNPKFNRNLNGGT